MTKGQAPLLSIVVPCYNSADYMERCLDSLLVRDADIEVIVVDDGSVDTTGEIADRYRADHPTVVRVIHQSNKGHGGAINAGIRVASGDFIKIVDSDDWLDRAAFIHVLAELRRLRDIGGVDLVVSNFVYEKVGRRRKSVVSYRTVLPNDRVFGWDDFGRLGRRQYFMMHALVYRTSLLREFELELPEHMSYVDNLYAFAPLPHVERLYYVDVDLYRYFIGRSDQSVAESVMIQRVDQQLAVNRLMIRYVPRPGQAPHGLVRYMTHYLEIVCAVSSTLLIREGSARSLALRDELWEDLRNADEDLYSRLRHRLLSRVTNVRGFCGRQTVRVVYWVAQRAVGFN